MNSSSVQHALSARGLLRSQFRLAHELLEAAIEQLRTKAAHLPDSTAWAAEARYAHVVLCEDLSINGILASGTPLALSTWVGRTGISDVPLLAGSNDWRAWGLQVRLDLAELRRYARAVYASTDDYLDALPDDALHTACGEMPACVLNALLLTLSMRRGEIACLHTLTHRSSPAKLKLQ